MRIYEDLNPKESGALEEMRSWALAQGDPGERQVAKLSIAQKIIDGTTFALTDTWKMNAVGVLFGDALAYVMDGDLQWVVVEDEHGIAFALRWKATQALIFPLPEIRTRLAAGEAVDVHALFAQYASLFPNRRL